MSPKEYWNKQLNKLDEVEQSILKAVLIFKENPYKENPPMFAMYPKLPKHKLDFPFEIQEISSYFDCSLGKLNVNKEKYLGVMGDQIRFSVVEDDIYNIFLHGLNKLISAGAITDLENGLYILSNIGICLLESMKEYSE